MPKFIVKNYIVTGIQRAFVLPTGSYCSVNRETCKFAQTLSSCKSLTSHLRQQPNPLNTPNIHPAESGQSSGEVRLDRNINTAITRPRLKRRRTSVETRHKRLKVSSHSKILRDVSRRPKPKKLAHDDKASSKEELNVPLSQPSGIFDTHLLFDGRLYQVIDLCAEVRWIPSH